MQDSFIRKKVSSLTFGEKLRKIRNEKRISLNEVSKNTQIQLKYLEYLEEGHYDKLPAEVYVKGFLRSYANFLEISEKSLIKMYERERKIQKSIQRKGVKNSQIKKKKPIKISSFVISSKMMAVAVVTCLILLGSFYIYKEIDRFVSVPRLVILSPASESTTDSNAIFIKGVTDRGCEAFINEQPILVDDKGEFNEEINLQRGLNIITIKSKNRLNKETVQTISIQAEFNNELENDRERDDLAGLENSEKSQPVSLRAEIYIDTDQVWLSVNVDGNLVYSGNLSPQVKQSFEAKEDISITSGKGNHTFIKINGEDRGALSEDPGLAEDVVFKAE